MKLRLFFLLSFLVFSAACMQAQVHAGLKGGFTSAWEYYGIDLPDDAEIRVKGANLGATVYTRFGKYFQVGLEPGYVRRGAACVPGWQPIFIGDTKYFLHYLEAPLMLSGRVPFCNNRLEVFAKAGYGASYLVRAVQEQVFLDINEPPVRQRMDLSGEFSVLNRIDHGAYSALGLGLRIGPGSLLAETQFYMGMRDAEKFNTSKNRSLSFSLGYSVGI